jgi:hypothetical protein
MKDQSAESHAPAAGGALRLERQLAKTSPAPAERDERPARERKKEAEAFPAAPASGAPGQQMPPASARSSEAAEARGVQGQPEQERAQEQSADALTNTAPAAHTRDDASKTASSNAVQAQGRLRENSTLAHDERAAPAKQKAAPEPADAAEPSRKAAAVASWESDPKAWLRHIESLVREQRLGEARDSFKAFRQRYPAYPIPAEFPLPER